MEGVKVHVGNTLGQSAVHVAADRGFLEGIKLLKGAKRVELEVCEKVFNCFWRKVLTRASGILRCTGIGQDGMDADALCRVQQAVSELPIQKYSGSNLNLLLRIKPKPVVED